MLVLTRKEGQALLIGDNVEVRVLKVRDGVAKIGITAPNVVPVRREEITEMPDKEA